MTFRRTPFLILVLLTGCSSWGGARPLDAVPMPATDRLEVWARGEAHELHAVWIDGDTVRGVPWWKDPACDSCRVAIPRLAVDSVRVRTYDGGKTGILLATTLLIMIPTLIFAAGMSTD